MKIKLKLTLLFGGITAIFLLMFALLIFLFATQNRKTAFFNRLKEEAISKASLVIDAQMDTMLLQSIYLNNRNFLSEVEVAIYDQNYVLIYHDATGIDVVKETASMLDEIKQKQAIQFSIQNIDALGILYQSGQTNYFITAAAYDKYGHEKLQNLLWHLSITYLFGLLCLLFIGHYLASRALTPIAEITQKARLINAHNLHERLKYNNSHDELSDLVNTINDMLNRLAASFEAQKEFVYHLSHEIRTPLATLLTAIELLKIKHPNNTLLQAEMEALELDANKLKKITNNLLNLARASYDKAEIEFDAVSVTDLILISIAELPQINPQYQASLQIENQLETLNTPIILGNAVLLKIAFDNLIENACKFSANQFCQIQLSQTNGYVEIKFKDQGIGIEAKDLALVFEPFFRVAKSQRTAGSGIGLSLVKRITNLHNGNLSITSVVGQGSCFSLKLPISK